MNLLINSDAPPDSVLIATGSVDQTGTYVFEVEPHAIGKTETKQLPYWSTAEGNDTMINLWNASSKDQDMVLTFFYEGGSYKYPVHLVVNGSGMISVKELQMMAAPDAAGNMLPAAVTTGSAWLSSAQGTAAELNVIASVGTFNVLTATCGTTCPTCLGYQNFWVSPNPFGLALGGNGSMDSYAQNTSGGVSSATTQSAWSSDNTSVAHVVSAGTFYGASAGSFNGQAQANLISANADCPSEGHSPCPTDPWQDQSPGGVANTGPYTPNDINNLESALLDYDNIDANGNINNAQLDPDAYNYLVSAGYLSPSNVASTTVWDVPSVGQFTIVVTAVYISLQAARALESWSEARGLADPPIVRAMGKSQPGRLDSNGNCDPNQPPSPNYKWQALNLTGRSAGITHWHWFEWNLNPATCTWYQSSRHEGPNDPGPEYVQIPGFY